MPDFLFRAGRISASASGVGRAPSAGVSDQRLRRLKCRSLRLRPGAGRISRSAAPSAGVSGAGPCGAFRILYTAGKITSVDLLTSLPDHPPAVTRAFRRPVGPPSPAPAEIQTALRALKSYFFLGRDPFIPVHRFSFDGLTAFTRNVILGTRRVPMGRTVTYTEFARMLNLPPGCRRAVGGALGRNPFPIFFPCHRIVGSGGLGGFTGGTAWKRRLLAHEGVSVE